MFGWIWFPPIASKCIDIESFLFDERDKRPNFWKTESTPWHTLAAGYREEVRKSFLADEPQCLFSSQRSQHLLVVDFSGGGAPGLEFILWIEWCFNVSILQLVATWLMVGLPTRGLTLRRWKNTRPFGPRCEPRATWWQFLVKVVQPNGGGACLGEKYRSCWKKKRQIALDMWGAVNLFEDQFSTDRAKMVQNVRVKVPKKKHNLQVHYKLWCAWTELFFCVSSVGKFQNTHTLEN